MLHIEEFNIHKQPFSVSGLMNIFLVTDTKFCICDATKIQINNKNIQTDKRTPVARRRISIKRAEKHSNLIPIYTKIATPEVFMF